MQISDGPDEQIVIPNNRNIQEIAVIGALVSDLLVFVEEIEVEQSGWQLALDHMYEPGGVNITSLAARRLGSTVVSFAWGGRDIIADFLDRQLNNEGIDVSQIIRLPSTTTTVVALIDPRGNHSRIVLRSSKPIESIPVSWKESFSGCSIVFMSGFACIELPIDVVNGLLDYTISSRKILVFDPQNIVEMIDKDLLERILGYTKILSIGEDEIQSVLSIKGASEVTSMQSLLQIGISEIFVRRGDKGVSLFNKAGERTFPAFTVTARNSLGAGDCFNGAVLYGLAHQLDGAKIALLGNAVAAIKVSRNGTGNSAPTRQEVIDFLLMHEASDLAEAIKKLE